MSGELAVFQQQKQRAPAAPARSPSPTDSQQADASDEDEDWAVPLAFSCERHIDKIVGLEEVAQTWRLKDRVNNCLICLHLQVVS